MQTMSHLALQPAVNARPMGEFEQTLARASPRRLEAKEFVFQDSAISARDVLAAAPLRTSAKRDRSGARCRHVAGLEAELSIDRSQMKAWAAFAETLSANIRRMDAVDGAGDHPFGRLEDRLAALRSMRRAAAALFSALDPAQQRKAAQLLPLCCLPTTGAD